MEDVRTITIAIRVNMPRGASGGLCRIYPHCGSIMFRLRSFNSALTELMLPHMWLLILTPTFIIRSLLAASNRQKSFWTDATPFELAANLLWQPGVFRLGASTE